MKNDFKFCPMCGGKNIQNHNDRKWMCPDCGFDLYANVAAAVGVVIRDSGKNVLFEVRAKNPQKGKLALPGGFINPDEKAEEAVVRECMEEIGAKINGISFLCTNPNTYPYKNIEYKTCDMFFLAFLSSDYESVDDFIKTLKAQESEVSGFVSAKVETQEDVDNLPLAFESTKFTLKEMINKGL